MNMKKRSKKGFTLIEMLIVIAIIAILAAIAIPTFSSQLTKANEAVDDANLRSAASLAVAEYMLSDESGAIFYSAEAGVESAMIIVEVATAGAAPAGTAYAGKVDGNDYIAITVTDGQVTAASWQSE